MDTGITNSRLESPTGATLNLYSLAARGTPRGVVQINHGLAEHAARYGRFMQALAQAGFHQLPDRSDGRPRGPACQMLRSDRPLTERTTP